MFRAFVTALFLATAPSDQPEPGSQTVVTATRLPRPIRDVAATVVVIPAERLALQPSQTLDAVFRTEPSVATFRRSTSLTADPTAQGLNLRGLGPSGVSRALLLIDGVPANDPFGGWIFWRSLPRLGLRQVEIAPSGGSATYGNHALGGVVNLVSRPIEDRALDATGSFGQRATGELAARTAGRVGQVAAAIEGELLTTDGYAVIASGQRGAVDREAFSRHGTLNGRAEWAPLDALTIELRGGYFDQNQNGGTALTDSGIRQTSYGARMKLDADAAGELQLDVYGRLLSFTQQRARFGPGRSTEALAATQRVSADDQGVNAAWRAPVIERFGRHRFAVGVDLRRVWGVSRETILPASGGEVLRSSGGGQQFAGIFVEDAWTLGSQWELSLAARYDLFRNSGGRRIVEAPGQPVRERFFEESIQHQISPRLGIAFRPLGWLTLRASGYRAFRAPTLNELYRPFQVGTVLTAANDALEAETVIGAESGVELVRGPTITRLTLFWNELQDPISNVTLDSPLPDGSHRQRQNLGRARVRGAELAFDWRIVRPLTASVAWTLVDPRVVEAPGRPELVGKQLAQDPMHRATAALALDAKWLASGLVQLRWIGPQFEDDLNALPMAGVVLVDLYASRELYGGVEVFGAVENLFDREYLVGRAGVDTIGQPFTARVGLRVRH